MVEMEEALVEELLMEWYATAPTLKFNSAAIGNQVTLAEALEKSKILPLPNHFITHVSIDLLPKNMMELFEKVIYDEKKNCYFSQSQTLDQELENLKARIVLSEKEREEMLEMNEKHKEAFDNTVFTWKQGTLRQTFGSWKRHIRWSKNHVQKVKIMFSKQWNSTQTTAFYFKRWQAFRNQEQKKRLFNDLEKGHIDLEMHEKETIVLENALKKLSEHVSILEKEQIQVQGKIDSNSKTLELELKSSKDIERAAGALEEVLGEMSGLVVDFGSRHVRNLKGDLQTKASCTNGKILSRIQDSNDIMYSWLQYKLNDDTIAKSTQMEQIVDIVAYNSAKFFNSVNNGDDIVELLKLISPESILFTPDEITSALDEASEFALVSFEVFLRLLFLHVPGLPPKIAENAPAMLQIELWDYSKDSFKDILKIYKQKKEILETNTDWEDIQKTQLDKVWEVLYNEKLDVGSHTLTEHVVGRRDSLTEDDSWLLERYETMHDFSKEMFNTRNDSDDRPATLALMIREKIRFSTKVQDSLLPIQAFSVEERSRCKEYFVARCTKYQQVWSKSEWTFNRDIFERCTSDDKFMCFTEFLAAITLLAAYEYPDPFQETEEKIHEFVLKHI